MKTMNKNLELTMIKMKTVVYLLSFLSIIFLCTTITHYAYSQAKSNVSDGLEITSPLDGAVVERSFYLTGTSTPRDNQHLWVFLQAENLCFPVGGEIKDFNEDGSWIKLVPTFFITGDLFIINVIWVDSLTNGELNNYFRKAYKIQSYPPIKLPKGSSSVSIRVVQN